LATMVAALAFAALALILPPDASVAATLGTFGVAVALLIVFTHRENIARLAAGTEFRFDKALLLHRLARKWRAGERAE
jgi:acyl phosphate:glycerol-3-phosphate acyltransferase